MFRRSLPFLLLTALLATLLVPLGPTGAAYAADEPDARATARSVSYLSNAREATNDQRARHHRRGLKGNTCLDRAAQRQAERMARSGLSHSPDFKRLGARCRLSTWGENVAQAYPDRGGRSVVRQWMHSSGHRANILSKRYRLLGMGAVKARGWWWVVQVFGRRA